MAIRNAIHGRVARIASHGSKWFTGIENTTKKLQPFLGHVCAKFYMATFILITVQSHVPPPINDGKLITKKHKQITKTILFQKLQATAWCAILSKARAVNFTLKKDMF